MQAERIVRVPEGRQHFWGHGGLHWWCDWDVWAAGQAPPQPAQDHAEGTRAWLPHGMLHRCEFCHLKSTCAHIFVVDMGFPNWTQHSEGYLVYAIVHWQMCSLGWEGLCVTTKKKIYIYILLLITLPHGQLHTVFGGFSYILWKVDAVTQGTYHGWRWSPQNYAAHNNFLM